MTNSITSSIAIDLRLLNNRYNIELQEITEMKLSEYETRSACIALDKKYSTVKSALEGLYDLGVQHTCNLSELLSNYNIIVGQVI